MPLILPADAPLKPADCGWPASAALAFAGWATVTDLDASGLIGGNPLAHLYALVARDPTDLVAPDGTLVRSERDFCAIRQDGSQTRGGVPTGWTFHGVEQQPVVTCQASLVAAGIGCARATMAVLDAVAKVGQPATRIALYGDMCLPPGEYCSLVFGPPGTQFITTAIVGLAGTNQLAYLYLFWLADGSISSQRGLSCTAAGSVALPVERTAGPAAWAAHAALSSGSRRSPRGRRR